MGGGSSCPPCASCKLLRRRCAKDCIFAPFFPSHDPHKFAIVHKVFGASNVSKMLQKIPFHQRGDAVSSLVFEASARLRDPVYSCVGLISQLQNQVSQLQMQLALAQAELHLYTKMQQQECSDDQHVFADHDPDQHQQQQQQHIIDFYHKNNKSLILHDNNNVDSIGFAPSSNM